MKQTKSVQIDAKSQRSTDEEEPKELTFQDRATSKQSMGESVFKALAQSRDPTRQTFMEKEFVGRPSTKIPEFGTQFYGSNETLPQTIEPDKLELRDLEVMKGPDELAPPRQPMVLKAVDPMSGAQTNKPQRSRKPARRKKLRGLSRSKTNMESVEPKEIPRKQKESKSNDNKPQVESPSPKKSKMEPQSTYKNSTREPSPSIGSGATLKSRISYNEDASEIGRAPRQAVAVPRDVVSIETRQDFLDRQHLLAGRKRKMSTWMAYLIYIWFYVAYIPFHTGYSIANAGLLTSGVLTVIFFIMELFFQHLLISALNKFRTPTGDIVRFDLGEFIKYSMLNGRNKKLKRHANTAKRTLDCIIVIFMILQAYMIVDDALTTVEEVAMFLGVKTNTAKMRTMAFTPLWLLSLLGDLRLQFPLLFAGFILQILSMLMSLIYLLEKPKTKVQVALIGERWTGHFEYMTNFFYVATMFLLLPYIRNEMKHPEYLNSRYGVINVGMVVYLILCMSYATLTCKRYGKYMIKHLVKNFPQNATLSTFIKSFSMTATFLIFPLILYPAINIILPKILCHVKSPKSQLVVELGVRAAILITVTLLIQLRSLGSILDSIFTIPMSILFIISLPPFLCYISDKRRSRSAAKRCFFKFLIMFGIFGSVVGLVGAICGQFMF